MNPISSAKVVGLTFIACLGLVSPATAQTVTLESLQATYSKAVAKIADDTRKQKDDALLQYGRNLGAVLASLKKMGDIDGYMVVEQEVKRLKSEKIPPSGDPNALFSKEVALCQKQALDAGVDASRRKADLLKRYVSALGNLVKDLMAKDKIADAKAAGDEKKAAELMLSEIEAAMPIVEVPAKVELLRCPISKDALPFQGHSYLLVARQVSWHEAKKECEKMGGHLVTISSQQEDEFVKQLAGRQWVWIGLTDEVNHGTWKWVDGSPFTYQGWAPRQPDNHKGKQHYGSLGGTRNNRWDDGEEASLDIGAYICEWDRKGEGIDDATAIAPRNTVEQTEQQPTVSDKKAVPADAREFKGHHYLLYTDTTDWTVAQQKCRGRGGHLVVIEDGDENAFVYELMHRHAGAWIGAEKSLGSWRWITSTPFSYQHWGPNQPNGNLTSRKLGSGPKAAMWGALEGDQRPLRGWWLTTLGNEPGGISAYVCEWDY